MAYNLPLINPDDDDNKDNNSNDGEGIDSIGGYDDHLTCARVKSQEKWKIRQLQIQICTELRLRIKESQYFTSVVQYCDDPGL